MRFHSNTRPKARSGWRTFLRRIRGHREATAFHRCLAVHMYFAAQR